LDAGPERGTKSRVEADRTFVDATVVCAFGRSAGDQRIRARDFPDDSTAPPAAAGTHEFSGTVAKRAHHG
jgi:hypothetical protein